MTNKTIISVGQKVQFDPEKIIGGVGSKEFSRIVTGTVIDVYPKHRWFLVEYGIHKLHTGFKFCNIGDGVKILG